MMCTLLKSIEATSQMNQNSFGTNKIRALTARGHRFSIVSALFQRYDIRQSNTAGLAGERPRHFDFVSRGEIQSGIDFSILSASVAHSPYRKVK
jgi:hypothetical protein